MTTDLKALRDIISHSVDAIIELSSKRGEPFPSLDNPVDPSVEFSPAGIRNDPKILDAAGLIVAAASQLIYAVRPPAATLTIDSIRWALPAALCVCNETNVAEIVRAAGPQGIHVNEISAKNGTNPKRLGRLLRYLATNHWFREVSPDVFAHNLLSSLLDTGRNFEDIMGDRRVTKYENAQTGGMSAIVGLCTDEGAKGGAWMSENFMDPKTANSEEPNHACAQRGLRMDMSLWDYYEQPGQDLRLRRSGVVMAATSKLQPPAAITSGFDWSTIRQGGMLVDVGGGLGHVSLEIAGVRPDLKIIIEDRPQVLKYAKEFWQENKPDHVVADRVQFVPHDFFEKQPPVIKNPDIFILRQITHDWSDTYVIKLFKHLRTAAVETTRLLVIDALIDYASEVPNDSQLAQIPGLQKPTPPKPLLPNLGGASLLSYSADVLMLSQLNGAERTIGGFVEVIEASGWKIVEVRRSLANPSWWPIIVAAPV